MIPLFLFSCGAIFGFFAICAAISDHLAPEDEDQEDLEWVDRQIEKVQNAAPVSLEAAKRQREHLERLRRVRERLLGH